MLIYFIKRPWKKIALILLAVITVNMGLVWVYEKLESVLAITGSGQKIIPIYRVGVTEKKLAISFDATWGTEYTDKLLDILDRYKIKTTFFLAGHWIKKYPDHVKLIAKRGHELGNHSWTHPHMNSLSSDQIMQELSKTNDELRNLTGKKPTLFRPPFGEYNNTVILTARECGLETVQWDVDSLDWKDLSASAIVDRVMSRVKPGSIVLFHNNGTHTAAAVDTIITRLKADGYSIVPISKLIFKGETWVDVNGEQKKASNSERRGMTGEIGR